MKGLRKQAFLFPKVWIVSHGVRRVAFVDIMGLTKKIWCVRQADL
jgi:hypothetical protein